MWIYWKCFSPLFTPLKPPEIEDTPAHMPRCRNDSFYFIATQRRLAFVYRFPFHFLTLTLQFCRYCLNDNVKLIVSIMLSDNVQIVVTIVDIHRNW